MEFSKAVFIGDSIGETSQGEPQWAFSGGFITGTYWSGAVQFSPSNGIPIAAAPPAEAVYRTQPHFGNAAALSGFAPTRAWQSEDKGYGETFFALIGVAISRTGSLKYLFFYFCDVFAVMSWIWPGHQNIRN
jgi:hypothetical protein